MPTRYVLVLGTFLLSMLCYVDRICISVAKDEVWSELALTDTSWGWVLGAFALGYALFQTPSGMLADRFGPRRILAAVVIVWSFFTALTGVVQGLVMLLTVRFLFGAGEAGAFPGTARAIYSWIPMSERGIAQGINFSGSRLGAAFALPAVAAMVAALGWRASFLVLGAIGVVWAAAWYAWFRDDPRDHARVSAAELALILAGRQSSSEDGASHRALPMAALLRSRNMWLVMGQYFASNFTFFFCLTWLFPHLKSKYDLDLVETGWYAMTPLLCGALGNWTAGALVDHLYRRGHWQASRRLTAMVGFGLAAAGLVASLHMEDVTGAVVCLSIAVFGADMTLSPSWAVCIDIGRRNSGMVSGTMNMAGNLGSFATAIAFPYLQRWTESTTPFFYVGAGLNVLAIVAWSLIRADRPLEADG